MMKYSQRRLRGSMPRAVVPASTRSKLRMMKMLLRRGSGLLRGALELEHVERPQLARRPDRAALAMLRVAGGEVGPRHPRREVLLRAPAREDEADVAIVVGPQQLERLEALGARDAPGA